ncbi:hypothetical protein AB4Y85_18245 [Microvirga sp. 2YAF29]|uniref:hypothetical protein n=1 Tax=Microvirga sp. 2YAF29 TaxID=3233031 RepID=UPI003F9D747B
MRLSGKRIEGADEKQDLTSKRGNTAEPDQIRQLAQQLRESGFHRLSERERRLLTQAVLDRIAAGPDYEINLKADVIPYHSGLRIQALVPIS